MNKNEIISAIQEINPDISEELLDLLYKYIACELNAELRRIRN